MEMPRRGREGLVARGFPLGWPERGGSSGLPATGAAAGPGLGAGPAPWAAAPGSAPGCQGRGCGVGLGKGIKASLLAAVAAVGRRGNSGTTFNDFKGHYFGKERS